MTRYGNRVAALLRQVERCRIREARLEAARARLADAAPPPEDPYRRGFEAAYEAYFGYPPLLPLTEAQAAAMFDHLPPIE